jgi:hypothetical protein
MMFSFSYSVTRQYPYRWFTPTAVVGGIILTILFSAINFFSNAYNMVTTTTDDPNKIEAGRWSGRVPGILTSKIQPTCEDAIIPVGSSIYTNQTFLLYQIIRVDDLPALTYHNTPIGNCGIEQIEIDFQTNSGRQAVLIDKSGWGVSVNAYISCDTPDAVLDLTARYDPLSETDEPGVSRFLGNYLAALEWADSLLLGFWTETVTAITNQTAQQLGISDSDSPRYNLSSGYIIFENQGSDIKDPYFFQDSRFVFFNNDSKSFRGNFSSEGNDPSKALVIDESWLNIRAPADRLAKAMYSAITADLGQTYIIPSDMSMIATPDRLRYWTENLTQIWNASVVSDKDDLLEGYVKMCLYNESSDTELGLSNSTISATYTCQVPHLKSGFNIFISIFVADIVLLRVAWSLYNLVVTYFLNSRHEESNLCLGCLERGREDDDTGSEEHTHSSMHTSEDTSLHGEVIELGDFGTGHGGQAEEPCLQKLLTRKPVGG